MRKLFTSYRLQIIGAAMVLLTSLAPKALADDRFAVAVGPHDSLVIFGPKGDRVAELPVPSISQPVTVAGTSFQVSFGRDANDLLTAIFAPNSSQPQDLHFNVLNKSVDASKAAVVTLTFSSALNHVTVDPGYVGSVAVNSTNIKHHDLVDANTTPRRVAPQPVAILRPATELEPADAASSSAPVVHHSAPVITHATATAEAQVSTTTTSASHEAAQPVAATSEPTSSPVPSSESDTVAHDASPPLPNRIPPNTKVSDSNYPPITAQPLVGSLFAQPPPLGSLNESLIGTDSKPHPKLYWSEPVTPPNGTPPAVGINEMKLVEVHGSVNIKKADGDIEQGREGTIVPSGATVQTTSDASSAAVFIGGVDSARLLPHTEVKITENLNGSVRHTSIDLKTGSVFSRVGRRTGETQDYQVKTSEGVAAARGTEFADHRGVGSDGKMHHYVFVAKGTVQALMGGVEFKLVSGKFGDLGAAIMPPSANGDDKAVLIAILEALQPFNAKFNAILGRIPDGTASPAEQAFYTALVNTFFSEQLPAVFDQFDDYPNVLREIIPAARRALNQDLQPFGTNPLTPF